MQATLLPSEYEPAIISEAEEQAEVEQRTKLETDSKFAYECRKRSKQAQKRARLEINNMWRTMPADMKALMLADGPLGLENVEEETDYDEFLYLCSLEYIREQEEQNQSALFSLALELADDSAQNNECPEPAYAESYYPSLSDQWISCLASTRFRADS